MPHVFDGIYAGFAPTHMIKAGVRLTAENHKISTIELIKHDNGLRSKAEYLWERMISANIYDVDAVTGATISSQVIKSAICNALSNSYKK